MYPSLFDSNVVLAEMSLVLMVLVPLWAIIPILPVLLYLYNLQIIFVRIFKGIYKIIQMHLFPFQYIFVKTVKLYLSKSQNGADGLRPPLSHYAHPLNCDLSPCWSFSWLQWSDLMTSLVYISPLCICWMKIWYKNSFVVANQICINRRVHPLCFVDTRCAKYAKGIQDRRHIYLEARCRQLFEANDAVSGGVILSILCILWWHYTNHTLYSLVGFY